MITHLTRFLQAITNLTRRPSSEKARRREGEKIASPPRLFASSPQIPHSSPPPAFQSSNPPTFQNHQSLISNLQSPTLLPSPPPQKWDDWTEYDPAAWPEKKLRRYSLIPTVCFNCESACGLLAYVDKETLEVQKFEGNPLHPGSRGRLCAKGPATLNQMTDPERILYPLKRAGRRGEGQWQRVTWDEVLDDIAGRMRQAILEERHNEIMYHVGRPGHDGYMDRVIQSWGVDGHNSHTNVCSASARLGYFLWSGFDRPSPDYAHARVILLISSHLETGHYFNPHAQRIIEGKMDGAKLIVLDPRLSNTSSLADHWLPLWPGSEAAVLLAIANYLIQNNLYDREFVRRWVNWETYLKAERPAWEVTFDNFDRALKEIYAPFSPEFAAQESGLSPEQILEAAKVVAGCQGRLAAHIWRAAASGNLGGWQVARCLFFLNVLTGSVGVPGGTSGNVWNKFVPPPFDMPPPQKKWNELLFPKEWPLSHYEMSFLLPHFLLQGRGKLDVYFTRVYNPVWTNPDGFTWLKALRDENLIKCHVALTPTWNESAWLADYVLPMGHAGERHDLMSQETQAGMWLAFRQPVRRVAMEKLGQRVKFTYEANPGEVWEEDEFWLQLSWRLDPDGSLGIRQHFESPYRPGQCITVEEYYRWIFEHSVPGLVDAAAKEFMTPLEYMRKYGCYEVARENYVPYEQSVFQQGSGGARRFRRAEGREQGRSSSPPSPKGRGAGGEGEDMPAGYSVDEMNRILHNGQAVGILIDGEAKIGFDTPSRKLEFYQPVMAEWGWSGPEYSLPYYLKSHVHPDNINREAGEMLLLPTFRLPTLIHTRSANAKWLVEISHKNPVWLHPEDAGRLGVDTDDLVKVETEIGSFVSKIWVTEGLRPGIVAMSHHLGRWRLTESGSLNPGASALVKLQEQGDEFSMRQLHGATAYKSSDPDTARIWWQDVGVPQNLIHAVHPDPVSGMHCWHQKVKVSKAGPDERHGDLTVDTAKSIQIYREWLALTRPAPGPGGLRRPLWFKRPLKPDKTMYYLAEVIQK